MGKFDTIRKKIKKNKRKIHFIYIFIILIFIVIGYYYFYNRTINYENELKSIITEYQSKSASLAETMFELLQSNKKYKTYFNSLPFGKPLKKIIINSTYGWRKHPIDSNMIFHQGIDLDGEYGDTVYSTGNGKIFFTGFKKGYGKVIIIKHSLNYVSIYAHLSKILIKDNINVKKGDIIGLVGHSGKATGNHLHYEIRINSKSTDPYEYLKINKLDFSEFN